MAGADVPWHSRRHREGELWAGDPRRACERGGAGCGTDRPGVEPAAALEPLMLYAIVASVCKWY